MKDLKDLGDVIFETHTPKTPLDEKEQSILASLLFSEMAKSEIPFNMPDFKELFPYKVVQKRIEVFNLPALSDGVIIFLIYLTEGNPGKLMTYLWFLNWKMSSETLPLSLSDFCETILPQGKFTEEQLNTIWNSQKVPREFTRTTQDLAGTDNLIDLSSAWIPFKI